mgnify:CR=1 FL=1
MEETIIKHIETKPSASAKKNSTPITPGQIPLLPIPDNSIASNLRIKQTVNNPTHEWLLSCILSTNISTSSPAYGSIQTGHADHSSNKQLSNSIVKEGNATYMYQPIIEGNNEYKNLQASQYIAKAGMEQYMQETRSSLYTQNLVEQFELVNRPADKAFTAKGGHVIKFKWKNGRPMAYIAENLPPGFSRKHKVPAYLLPGMSWEQLLTVSKIEQPYRIDVIWSNRHEKTHVLIGSLLVAWDYMVEDIDVKNVMRLIDQQKAIWLLDKQEESIKFVNQLFTCITS